MKTGQLVAIMALFMMIMIPITIVIVMFMGGGQPTPQTFVCADGSVVTNTALCPTTGVTPTGTGQCFGGIQTKVSAGGKEIITGTAVNVNVELWTADGAEETGETNANAAVTSISTTFPVQASGYAMVGNDAGQSGTDRGTEYYYYKKAFTTGCGPAPLGLVELYAEGTPTWTCYDDGTAETTCNITMGTSVVDTTELKITTSANSYLGMPKAGDNMPIQYPLGVCFNVTTDSDWDKVYPSPYSSGYSDASLGIVNGKFDAPGNLSTRNILGDCYVLDTKALRDPAGEGLARYTRFWVIFDPTATGTLDTSDSTHVFLLDLCWSKNDARNWRLGFTDESEQGTDLDCGMDAIANAKAIYHA